MSNRFKEGSPLIREIFLTYLEYKQPNISGEYQNFLEQYVDIMISEQPFTHHENYYAYWNTLIKDVKQKRIGKTEDKF